MDTTRITTISNSAVVENPLIIHGIAQPSSATGAGAPISEAVLSCIGNAVDAAFELHNQTNGSTVSLIDGNMVGTKHFSVSIYPTRSVVLWERPTRHELFDFALANLELLLKPANALGTWFDDWNQVHVLDVVLLVSDRDAALELGLRFDQLAIFDLESRQEIPIARPSEALLLNGREVGNV